MKTQRRSSFKANRIASARRSAGRRFSLPELLEARTMLSAYVVTSNADSGAGTLRDAIATIHLAPGVNDTITFSQPMTITLQSPLQLADPVTINGLTDGSGHPLVQLDGGSAVSTGLEVDSAGVNVNGLAITDFMGAGIVLESGGSDVLSGNYIGIDPTGTFAMGNGTGVSILSGHNLLSGNVISGNAFDGVDVSGDGNMFAGNLIGTDATGELAVGNGNAGVVVDTATNTVIGGASAAARNIISGNNLDGVVFTNDVGPGNMLENNYIGLDITGFQPLGNGNFGVNVGTIDDLAVSDLDIVGNVISANLGNGIFIEDGSSIMIQGNWIGTDGSGHAGAFDPNLLEFTFQNGGEGILLEGDSTGNLIGGSGAGAANIISGNSGSGVNSSTDPGTVNTVQGNLLGIDVSHAFDGNGANGVTVHSGKLLVIGNTISANQGDGVLLDQGGGVGVLTGNYIGTDASLSPSIGNASDGVFVLGSNNVIGGTAPGAGNIIAYNMTAGVFIYAGQNNAIRGNSMFSNVELGIGLGSESDVLPNNTFSDPSSPGPNNNQNYPVINSVTGTVGGSLTVTGTMQGAPSTTYALDFFSNTSEDDSGYGEGQTYLGSLTTVTTDVNGNATFTATFSNVPAGQTYWSATATDPAGNTSEFALDAASVISAPEKSATTTGVSSSLNPSTFGQQVTFTATVNPDGGVAPLTGTISFVVNNIVMKVVTLDGSSDSATWTVSLSGGNTAVSAVYSGDDNYVGSQGMLTQTVARAATTTSITSSLNPSLYGQGVTFTATVTGHSGTSTVPTGTVTFTDNGNPIGTATLNANGVANLTTSALTVGSHTIMVMYNSDANYASSAGSLTQTVNAAAGTISGHTYFDVTGNGLSSDDKLMAGITVKLFQDKNGNGTLDAADGAAIKTTVSDNNGAYAFGGITPGKYFVQEVTPSGYVRTAPTVSTYYTDVMTSGLVIASNDFDNYQTGCCCNSVTNVKFIVDNKYCYTDLRGHIHQGDTVQVQFTVTSGHTDLLSLVSYTAPDSTFNANDASEQQVYQAASGTFGPGTHSMTVVVPQCYFQIDFVCGSVINQLGPAGSNIFYSAQDRLISADNGGYVPPPAH